MNTVPDKCPFCESPIMVHVGNLLRSEDGGFATYECKSSRDAQWSDPQWGRSGQTEVCKIREIMLLTRRLNAANERIEALNRGNANAERILCELTGCESGRDVPDWIVAAKERIKRLEHGTAKQNLEIEQTCGKVLDYPWFKNDQTNFPEATEKDGVCVGEHVAETIAAELARKYTEAKERIKRLEEALKSIQEYWNRENNNRAMIDACWYAIDTASEALESKEAKP